MKFHVLQEPKSESALRKSTPEDQLESKDYWPQNGFFPVMATLWKISKKMEKEFIFIRTWNDVPLSARKLWLGDCSFRMCFPTYSFQNISSSFARNKACSISSFGVCLLLVTCDNRLENLFYKEPKTQRETLPNGVQRTDKANTSFDFFELTKFAAFRVFEQTPMCVLRKFEKFVSLIFYKLGISHMNSWRLLISNWTEFLVKLQP